jgi:hypothetical protein
MRLPESNRGGGPTSVPRAKDLPTRRISWRVPATAPTSDPSADYGARDPQEPRVSSTRSARSRARLHGVATTAGASPPLRRCRRRTCPGYAAIWAGDQRQKLFANLNADADGVPSGVRSPPSWSALSWRPEFSAACIGMSTAARILSAQALRRTRLSGQAGSAAPWNESAAQRWRELHHQV